MIRKAPRTYLLLRGMVVSWSFEKQSVVALSSSEEEYIATTMAICQDVWMNRLIGELTNKEETKVNLMVDNQSAITLSKNQVVISPQSNKTH